MYIKVENKEQIQTVVNLAREIWIEHYVKIIGIAQVEYMLNKFQSTEAIKIQINEDNYEYYLIESNGTYVGYFAFQFKDKELFLSKIYVISSERGKGLAKAAFKFIEDIGKENSLNKIYLTVNKENKNSITTYEKIGFKKVGTPITDIGNGYVMDDYKLEKTY